MSIMKRGLVGLALAGNLMLSGAEHTPTPEPPAASDLPFDASAPLSTRQLDQIKDDFDSLRAYWIKRGLGASGIRLVILEGEATVTCEASGKSATVSADDPAGMAFCFASNEVIIGQAGVNLVNYLSEESRVPKNEMMRLVLAHEIGHGIQRSLGYSTIHDRTVGETQVAELQADCYAGEALSHINPAAVQDAYAFYAAVNSIPSPTHSTAPARADSFVHGFTTGDC